MPIYGMVMPVKLAGLHIHFTASNMYLERKQMFLLNDKLTFCISIYPFPYTSSHLGWSCVVLYLCLECMMQYGNCLYSTELDAILTVSGSTRRITVSAST